MVPPNLKPQALNQCRVKKATKASGQERGGATRAKGVTPIRVPTMHQMRGNSFARPQPTIGCSTLLVNKIPAATGSSPATLLGDLPSPPCTVVG